MKGNWEEEEKCPRVSPLTLTGVTKGPKGKRQKEVMVVDAEIEQETNAENDRREIEEVLDSVFSEAEEEEPFMVSPTHPSFLEVQEQVPAEAEGSRSREGNTEIMEMLRAMKREMEERELKWERQQQIKEEFMEAARRKEQIWEENWRIREEEHKEELKKQ